MYEAVIVDVDGTIVDSVELHAEAWQAAFEKFGKNVALADTRRQIGKGSDQLLPVFLSPEEIDRFGAELDQYRGELFKKSYLPRVKGFPRVRELFERIKRSKKRIVLASSAKPDELTAYKQAAQIEDLIDGEVSSGDAEKSKPHADIFVAALERLRDLPRDQVIVIGDTPYDAEAGAKAALTTIGFLSGVWSEEELRQAGCIAIYQNPADLLVHYQESPLS